MKNRKSKHRRKRVARLAVGPSEQTSEYPGFFVLPRANSPSRRRAEQLKAVMIGLLVLGGFIAGMAYFFFQFGITWTATSKEMVPFVLDPKSRDTSVDYGGGRR